MKTEDNRCLVIFKKRKCPNQRDQKLRKQMIPRNQMITKNELYLRNLRF